MTTDGPGVAPFTRFSRIGFGLGLKQHTGSRLHGRDGKKKPGDDEDWYIPYNGPYEAPREIPQRRKERDSWGDPISGEDDGYDDEKDRFSDQELRNRYGSHADFQRLSRGRYGDEAKGRLQGRPQSAVSGHTMSSGNLDPTRASIGIPRRSTVSAGTRPQVPSYVDTDAVTGVGGSPMPPVIHANEKSTPSRRNFANMFSLAGQKSLSLDHDRVPKTPFKKGPSRLPINSTQSRDARHQVFLEWPSRTNHNSPSTGALNSIITDDEDYYNSYYSTLVQTPKQSTPPFQSNVASSSHQGFHPPEHNPPSSYQHPYATAHPRTQPDDVALPSLSKRGLTFTQPIRKPTSADTPHFHLPRPMAQMQQLKSSTSTPDLRIASRASSKPPLPIRVGASYPKGKDRWLSAETWCDALLFPRPRLKVKQDGEVSPSILGSGRIVSPPGTPVVQTSFNQQMPQEVMPSRVLAHTRSMMDLSGRNESTGHSQSKQGSPSKHSASRSRPEANLHTAKDLAPPARLRPPRPKSFAQDDLALLATPLSLERVLEEGDQLENQRKQWKAHAVESFGNKHTRNISRARSKSLTQKGKRVQYEPQSNIDFLAARACLGDQNIVPVFTTSSQHTKSQHTKSFEGSTSGRGSHSHSNSLVKTVSSKTHSHSRGHSRTDSWGKSALKMAKNTVGLCGFSEDVIEVDAMEEKLSGLEGALKREGTRVIRLADPAQIPVDRGFDDHRIARGVSPSSSGISESRMGIALSTPPPDDPYELDSIRLSSHPYAQGGMYTLSPTAPETRDKGTDYAGAHPLTYVGAAPDLPSILARHAIPVHVGQHPYTLGARDSKRANNNTIQHPPEGSPVSPQSKMWVQVSPGVVREILQGENQYSSFMSRKGSQESPTTPYDKLSASDALVYALSETHRDSGLGTSENHHGQQHESEWRALDAKVNTPEIIQRIHRLPAQYDVIRPSLTPQKALSSKSYHTSHHTSNHTAASSPLEHAINFLNPNPKGDALTPSPALTSEGSSPNLSPHPLGSPNDLEGFQDLFYKPSPVKQAQIKAKPDESPSQLAHIPWDLGSRGQRTGSGLTSLARQLSEEFEQMALERTNSQYSRSSTSIFQNNSLTRRPTEGSLEFLFEEPFHDSPDQESFDPPRETIMAFKPSVNLPEDIESSRASTPFDDLEEAEDQTARFRVGMVESVSTPPAIFSDERRISFSGQLSSSELDKVGDEGNNPSSRPRTLSGLQPSPTNAARSSYVTTSDASRMSGLSDFPSPPKDALAHKHLSLLSSYFDEAHSQSEARDVGVPPLPLDFSDRRYTFGHIPPDASRVTFGDDANAEDLAAALSSSPSSRI